jgi:hypothetical protein
MTPTLSPSELADQLDGVALVFGDSRPAAAEICRASARGLREREAECERLRATLPMQALGAATARIHELVEVLLAIRSEAEEAPPGNADPWIVAIQRLVTDALPSPQEPK